MNEEEKDLLPSTTPQETAIDVAAALASIVPWVGGPVGAVLAGMSLTRKINRVREVLINMAEQIKDFQLEASEKYVKTEDFQDLLEKTLRQVADERDETKREAYAAFLANDIKSPGEPYDEKVRILRTLEEVQADHIRLLKALLQEPDLKFAETMVTGSISQTLRRRLRDMSPERIADLAHQLVDMRLAELSSLNTTMTARGAEDLRSRITTYGHRFIQYIIAAS